MHRLEKGTLIQDFNVNPFYNISAVNLDVDASHPLAAGWPPASRRWILIAEGQSNFAQYYDSVHLPAYPWQQFEFLLTDGTLRRFKEPIFGPGAAQLVGSLHGKLGDDIITAGLADNVVWVPVAIGGTNIAQWSGEGQYLQNLIAAVRRLKHFGYEPSAIMVMRGEADSFQGTSQADYFERASRQIQAVRDFGCACPWYIARQSYLKLGDTVITSADVIAAQDQLISEVTDVYAGPSLDDLGDAYRFEITGTGDKTHFNGELGRETVSSRWVTALTNNPPAFT